MKHLFFTVILSITAVIASACGAKSDDSAVSKSDTSTHSADTSLSKGSSGASSSELPVINADSVYQRVADQVAFGPRVPGSPGHDKCVQYIKQQLAAAGAEVTVQDTLFAPSGTGITKQRIQNITGIFNAGAPRHVMLLAHYDTRPWADQEYDETLHSKPIDGANDGASGVGVLLEIARLMNSLPKDVEVEMLFTDAEDGGGYSDDISWCIGSQAWAESFDPKVRRVPQYAILLDMVGGKNALFSREYFSQRYAAPINDKVWETARKLGYGDRFPNVIGGALNDDHIHIMRVGIPTIDIVECSNPETDSFNPTWHTLDDNLDNIDASTLKMVGDVVINTIFQ